MLLLMTCMPNGHVAGDGSQDQHPHGAVERLQIRAGSGGGADVRLEAHDAFAKRYGVPAFASIEDICRRDDIDAVWIATPNNMHAAHVVLAEQSHEFEGRRSDDL